MLRALSLLLILCNTYLASADYMEVSFTQATPDEAKEQIAENGQYALVYFTADWCLPCQVLQESHFRDERVIHQINNGFVSVKADYSEQKDIPWYDTYEVRMLPTLLVMDKYGNEIDRIQNIRNTRQLYMFLHQYSRKPAKTAKESKPMAYKLDVTDTPAMTAEPKSEIVTVSHKSRKAYKPRARLVSSTPSEENIYAVDIATYSKGLSIQFAAYTRYGNALKYLKELQAEGLSVSILEEYVKGKKYFKVVQRVSKSNINSLYSRYQSEGKECFIRPANMKS